MKKVIFLLLIAIGSLYASEKTYGNVVVDEVTSIYDSDTFRVNIKLFPDILGERVPIRVAGVDTPEMKGKCQKEILLARKAKQITVAALRGAHKIELKNIQRGKYFRIVADVYIDGQNLAETLIGSGLAVRYYGGHKSKDWCAR